MDIEIKNLNVNINEKEVLKDFNLNIEKGKIHVIMGPNGVGKSTLAKVIMKDPNYTITSGDILVNSKSILPLSTDERARLGIFLSFQNPVEIEGISDSEFLKTAINSKEKVDLYDFIMNLEKYTKDLDLKKELIHRNINENFSGGEKKKNEILQMKVLKPKFIILDELDSGLDVDSLKIVCNNVNNYLKENKDVSVLMITHYLRILEYIKPDYVHVLLNGSIVDTGTYDLALEIDKNGYKKYTSCASLISED